MATGEQSGNVPQLSQSNPVEDIAAAMDRYDSKAKGLTTTSLANFVAGAALTGMGAYWGAKGNNVALGVEIGFGLFSYGFGAIELTIANRNSQQAAALRGALAQHELANRNGNTSTNVRS